MNYTPRVLAVDDDAMNLSIIEEALDGLYDVLSVRSGAEALLEAYRYKPDVILLDVMMPQPDGYQVCAQIKKDPRLRDVRIVMVSAKFAPESRRIGYFMGADDFLTKPYSMEELIAKVNVACEMKDAIQGSILQHGLGDYYGIVGEVLAILANFTGVESGDHLLRLGALCQTIAKELVRVRAHKADEKFVENLYSASVLHDVGKIASLRATFGDSHGQDSKDIALLIQHTMIGENLLELLSSGPRSDKNFFLMAAKIARSHHENWDGTGYPDGLKGHDIPLEARIVRVADAFDEAMRRALDSPVNGGAEEIFQDIKKGSGVLFDPVLVEAISTTWNEVMQIYSGPELACDAPVEEVVLS